MGKNEGLRGGVRTNHDRNSQQDSKKTRDLLDGFALPMMNGVASIAQAGYDERESFKSSSFSNAESEFKFTRWVFAGDL